MAYAVVTRCHSRMHQTGVQQLFELFETIIRSVVDVLACVPQSRTCRHKTVITRVLSIEADTCCEHYIHKYVHKNLCSAKIVN